MELATVLFVVVSVLMRHAEAAEERGRLSLVNSVEEAFQKQRCVPTAVARGPCHICVCNDKGVYHCHSEDCQYEMSGSLLKMSKPECEPNMLYTEGILFCSCSAQGYWQSANCRAEYRFVLNKKHTHVHPPPKIPCETGELYVSDCNVCECRGVSLSAAFCTNRTCPAHETRGDPCILGQLLRVGTQLCACNEIGNYDDHHCVTLSSNDPVVKVEPKVIASLTVLKNITRINGCNPNTTITKDCNQCTCDVKGQLSCTSKLCQSESTQHGNTSLKYRQSLRKPINNLKLLPELKSEVQPCIPGQKYRFQCKTCFCNKKGVPKCSSMVCYDNHLWTNSLKGLKGSSRLSKKYQLPQIKHGDNCTLGSTYRMDCNICHCALYNQLICTKKLCLSPDDIAAQKKFEDKMRKKQIGKSYVEMYDDKLVMHQRVDDDDPEYLRNAGAADRIEVGYIKDMRSQSPKSNDAKSKEEIITSKNPEDNKSKENKTEDDNMTLESNSKGYPQLPQTKCKPGQIYSKGCQRCYCTHKKIAQCTNRPCDEMKDPVEVPTDVYPRVSQQEIVNFPSLPHEAAKCLPGQAYTVECNFCLCLANGNLLCNNLLCLSIREVNKIASLKHTEKACKKIPGNEAKFEPEVTVECINCSCVKGKLDCSPIEDCTPHRLKQALRTELDPSVNLKFELNLGPADSECIPGMVYRQNCNNCYCQEDGSLRCTRKGCLNYQQVKKLREHRERLLESGL